MILVDKATNVKDIGGKAFALLSLQLENIPWLRVVPASFFDDASNSPGLMDCLIDELNQVLQDGKLYAVRSSAVDEDSTDASFAGIHESFLNVGKKQVFQHVLKVHGSAFSPRAIAYRKAKNLPTDNVKIAVIIQEMVQADFSGVAFTINPVTDNPDEVVLSVTEGLGDKLVDGTVSGTTYTINAQDVEVVGQNLLSKRQISSILATISDIVAQNNCFLDIEFAIVGNKTYVLQARPITNYKHVDAHKRSLLIDNANIIESYFGVTSPLTFSFAKDVYRDVYTATLNLGKVRPKIMDALKTSLSEMLFYHEGKIYYNMNSWYHVNSVFPFKKSATYMENMMGVKSRAQQISKVKMNLLDMAKLGVRFVLKVANIDKLTSEFERNFNKIVLPFYGKKIEGTNKQLFELFQNIQKDIVKQFTTPIISDSALMMYFGMLKDKAKRNGISSEQLNEYISNHGQVKSAGSATDLMEIVRVINADAQMLQDFSCMSAQELAQKYSNNTAISQMLQDYKFTYGARVRDELKLETVTMIEDETLLFALVKDNLEISAKREDVQEKNPPRCIKKLVEKTKKFIQNRERLRLYRTYVYSVVRNIFLAYGRNFVEQGALDAVEDVFLLTKQEIFQEQTEIFRQVVDERKLQLQQFATKPTYNRVVFFGDVALPVKIYKNGNGLRGIPSGNGVVKARVSLMNSTKDNLQVGNIILTKRTDPGWIGLFPKASGLIVEHGSMLSHSFVVARELNLPAVVGVEGATSIIPNNSLVTLDGLKGEITLEN